MDDQIPRLDKSVFSVTNHADAEKQDKEYWLLRTPEERMEALEILRRMVYGDKATARLQRVLKLLNAMI